MSLAKVSVSLSHAVLHVGITALGVQAYLNYASVVQHIALAILVAVDGSTSRGHKKWTSTAHAPITRSSNGLFIFLPLRGQRVGGGHAGFANLPVDPGCDPFDCAIYATGQLPDMVCVTSASRWAYEKSCSHAAALHNRNNNAGSLGDGNNFCCPSWILESS